MSDLLHIMRPQDPQWDRWLDLAPHDFYHLSDYHAFAQSVGEGEAEMLVYGSAERFLAWPYLRRDIDSCHSDLTSAYGYTGPVGVGLEDEAFRMAAWAAFRQVWEERQLVTLFTRFHPLLENSAFCRGFEGVAPVPGGEILHMGRSVSINLADDRATRRAYYRRTLRQQIRRAEFHGVTVSLDRDWRHCDRFVEVYRSTMQRNKAAARYHFGRDYVDRLRQALDGRLHLAVAELEGEVIAAMLFSVYNGIAQAHFGGADAQYSRLSPLKAVIDGIADFARDLGAVQFHIGAGRGGAEDSLYQFKSLFSKARHSFTLGRWILDAEANAALSSRSGAEEGTLFFPAYRTEDAARAVA